MRVYFLFVGKRARWCLSTITFSLSLRFHVKFIHFVMSACLRRENSGLWRSRTLNRDRFKSMPGVPGGAPWGFRFFYMCPQVGARLINKFYISNNNNLVIIFVFSLNQLWINKELLRFRTQRVFSGKPSTLNPIGVPVFHLKTWKILHFNYVNHHDGVRYDLEMHLRVIKISELTIVSPLSSKIQSLNRYNVWFRIYKLCESDGFT